MRLIINLFLGVACIAGSLQIQAQRLGLEYDTELQTDFKGAYNYVNLLRLNGSVNVSQKLTVEAATISISKTRDEPLIDDMQGYSNIEEEGLPLGIAVLGAEYRNRLSTFFLGIRNVNEDYFTSPVTSLFINSSCGIFPTISGNYDIANYPLSSWCIHYKAEWDKLMVQTSLYDGLGHRRITGHDNVFSFSPGRDGIFSITSLEYNNNGSNYSLGCALYYGVHHSDEDGIEEVEEKMSKKASIAPWLNIEHRLAEACSLMLQGSYSTSDSGCRCYCGVGATYSKGNMQFGLFGDYARYKNCNEIATELTCKISLTPLLSVQPAIEVISTNSRINTIGIVRLSLCLM